MAKRIAKFEKVSFKQFDEDYRNARKTLLIFGEPDTEEIEEIYRDIKLPKRSTGGSAGYDFYSPIYFILAPGEDIVIPTGIRCQMEDGWWLMFTSRSGLGFKYYIRYANLLPTIDSDYAYSDNEGHIILKIRNESKDKTLVINRGDKFAQGIFTEYGITYDDDVDAVRNGGFGSTGR